MVFYHTSEIVVLDVEVMKSKAAPEGNGSVPQDKSGLGGLTMDEISTFAEEVVKRFDRGTSRFDHESFEDTGEKQDKLAFSRSAS